MTGFFYVELLFLQFTFLTIIYRSMQNLLTGQNLVCHFHFL